MASVIWLVRHGNRQDFVDPAWRESARFPDDPPLSADGFEQARRLARRLREERISAIYASPFLRTLQTANEVARELDLSVRVEPGFGEHLNPEWFPRPPELHPMSELAQWVSRLEPGPISTTLPNYPETTEAAHRRAARTVDSLVRRHVDPVLLVGHGASVSGAVLLLAREVRETPCPLTGVFKLVRVGEIWKVELRADTSHLDASAGPLRYH